MSSPGRSEVLDLFAVAYRRSTDALAEFIAAYPEQAGDLVDYAHELNLLMLCSGERPITLKEESWIEAEVGRMSEAITAAVDPFAGLQPGKFIEARKALGVPSVVLESFRDRTVDVASVPLPFLRRFSAQFKTEFGELVRFLEGSPRLAPNLAFKADAPPQAPADKISFAAVLRQAGVPVEKAEALLEEDD